MALTAEQHAAVLDSLHAEQQKALRALNKAQKAYAESPYVYGDCSTERATACHVLTLRQAQFDAAGKVAQDYFNAYILPNA